ncbi:hypothetical protein DBT44_0005815 [Aerococcus mictus]|uniref:Uncharacterized protein n=1 Tax=Aerococcus mictus TaxID=2976810 RepID=A0ABZ2EAM1_9LACT|nr:MULTISPECIES: hypothetical protein [Aerococcus]MDK6231074.1 hypothetical protein [Aerococcus urinae]MDK6907775.1 hypothetical protein [Aerococcus urinae]MDL5174992.1 hypothetical protein [Aerococcus mictus]
MNENQQGVKWGELIVGIIFIILAIISFRNPTVSLVSLIYFLCSRSDCFWDREPLYSPSITPS